MSYRLEWSRSAAREVRRLPVPTALRVASAVGKLAQDPHPTGSKKLVGHSGLWRIRIGAYRVIYFIDDGVRVFRVERVTDRKDAYR